MPFMQVDAGAAFIQGSRNQFWDTYNALTADVSKNLSLVMDLSVPSDAYREIYPYFETSPHPRFQRKGDPMPENAMRATYFTCVNHPWAMSIPWHVDDEEDDQTKSLLPTVLKTAEKFALLPERVFFEIVTNTVDPELLPQIPVAPDGTALFSASTRFGATSGNLLTGTGVTTTSAIQTDFYTALSQFALFQDTKGQPLIAPELIDKGVIVIAPVALQQVFRQAFIQKMTAVVFGSNTAAAAPTNLILDSGQNVQLWFTPRLTGNSWIIALTGLKHRPAFKQTRTPLRDYLRDETNSDRARDFGERRWQWRERAGYGLSLPYNIIYVSNS